MLHAIALVIAETLRLLTRGNWSAAGPVAAGAAFFRQRAALQEAPQHWQILQIVQTSTPGLFKVQPLPLLSSFAVAAHGQSAFLLSATCASCSWTCKCGNLQLTSCSHCQPPQLYALLILNGPPAHLVAGVAPEN